MPASEIGRMSAWELTEWAVFEKEFGPLTVQERIDAMSKHVSGKDFEWRRPQPLGEGETVTWLRSIAGGR